jgi:hypothetical protein
VSGRSVGREAVVRAVAAATEPLEGVHAAWEAGAASFGRIDAWSDIDINVDAEEGRARDIFRAVEGALSTLSPIDLKFEVPFPPDHPYEQAFYRLADAGPFLLVDLAVFKRSSPDKFLEPVIHGPAVFLFNKSGLAPPPFDRAAFLARIRGRAGRLRMRRELFGCFIEKERRRGNTLEALANYQHILYDTLVEALRMRHGPERFDFGARYLHYELPGPVLRRLRGLAFVKDEADLWRKARRADRWLAETLEALDFDDVERRLKESEDTWKRTKRS